TITIMQTNDHIIRNYDLILDEAFGKQGTPERAKAEEDAYNFYSGQISQNFSKERGFSPLHNLNLHIVPSLPFAPTDADK
ncbi:MAG: hypothetical protein J6U21_10360, partial [Bacteroidales bacterium]|nr:hypothetical protein [Bacteroidales bacterium]